MAYTVTKNLILPSTITGSYPRPRWLDMSMWGKSLDTCMLDIRFREKASRATTQVMGLFLDIHTPKYKDDREVVWDMAVAMNQELLALRDAGCQCIQIEEPTPHFMANTFGPKSDQVKFMIECYDREVQGLDDVEIWIHTCWGYRG